MGNFGEEMPKDLTKEGEVKRKLIIGGKEVDFDYFDKLIKDNPVKQESQKPQKSEDSKEPQEYKGIVVGRDKWGDDEDKGGETEIIPEPDWENDEKKSKEEK